RLAVVRLADWRRSVESLPVVAAAAATAAVGDLRYTRHSVAVHRLGEGPQVGNHPVVEEFQAIPGAGGAGRMDARRDKAHDEAGAAAGLHLVVADGALRGHAILGQCVRVSAAADPVLDRARPDTQRRE